MLQIVGWVGGWGGPGGGIVIPMPEALSFAESRSKQDSIILKTFCREKCQAKICEGQKKTPFI
jgi:hypothetical protein